MKFASPLIKATLIKRYKRFLADVRLENGDEITAHCANPGAMLGLKEPGSTVWLSPASNPKRKLKYSWELIETNDYDKKTLVGINTSLPNKLAEEAILNGTIKELQGYSNLRREVEYGQNSRIDILLENEAETEQIKSCYVEIKNVHLLRQENKAEFPDSVTSRGAKHLNELSDMVKNGNRAVMLYLIQREDCKNLSLATDIDSKYHEAFLKAKEAGVEAIAYKCSLTTEEIKVTKRVKFI